MSSLIDYYKHNRIVNINANIIAAGVLSTILTTIVIHYTRFMTDLIFWIVLKTLIVDALLDGVLYLLFHWWSNHHLFLQKHDKYRHAVSSTLVDAGRVQVHRIILSPLYYILASGTQTLLLLAGMGRTYSVVVAYLFALVITRTLHTIYGMKSGLFDRIV